MTWPEEDRRKGPVEATVVGAKPGAGPIPAMVVGDRRDFFGKRLGQFALALLVLFFVIASYIQSARNGVLLERASQDRSELISSLEKATATIDRQNVELNDLRSAVSEQNRLLRDAGIPTVPIVAGGFRVPGVMPSPTPEPSQVVSNTRFTESPPQKPTPTTAASPSPRPTATATPSPSPSPTPYSAFEIICDVTTIICLN